MVSRSCAPRVDVVTVPDFSNPKRRAAFALRALFFLASWGQYAGTARDSWRVHLVCIGEPPACVRALADEVGARIERVAPLSIGRSVNVNKLRGLEIAPANRVGERVWLLDTDIFFLGDPKPLIDQIAPDALSAAPSDVKWVPEAYWKRIYAALELPEPKDDERIALLRIELGLWEGSTVQTHNRGGGTTDLRVMRPYWNGGVMLAPWDAPLRSGWEAHLAVIYDLFAPPRSMWERATLWLRDPARAKPRGIVSTSDMAGLATAIQAMCAQGRPFERLPEPLHARRSHLQSGAMTWSDPALWHATGFAQGLEHSSDFAPHRARFGPEIDALLDAGAKRRGEDVAPSTRVAEWLNDLWTRRIAPVIAAHPLD